MNWVCDSCGYENEFNDESQPTECLCCGDPAPEHKLIEARRELEKFHKEQERQARLEQLRLEAIKRQEKIDRLVGRFVKCVKTIPAVCIITLICAALLAGLNVYQGNISPKLITNNIKNTSHVETVTNSVSTMLDYFSDFGSGYIKNISNNFSTLSEMGNDTCSDNVGIIIQAEQMQFENMKQNTKQMGNNIASGSGNLKQNVVVSQSIFVKGFDNLSNNLKIFWNQASNNVKELIDSISKKIGRT